MNTLGYPDLFFLEAAKGWYLLGDLKAALAELDYLTPGSQLHPDVLEVRFALAAKLKDWVECMELSAALLETAPDRPTSWINCAVTLHELRQTQDAWNALYTVHDRWPEVPAIPYNLACYACRLGRIDDSRKWLEQAMKVGGGRFRRMAMEDADLQPLWPEINAMP